MKKAIGIDIGGTKIAVGSISAKGQLSGRVTRPSCTADAETMFQSVIATVEHFLAASQTSLKDYVGMGVGVPGKVNQTEGVAVFQNNLPWADFPLVERLREVFPFATIKLDNDVYQSALAEWSVAEMAPEDVFVYFTISTGISCSIIQGGQFLRGAGFAGEVGLVPVISPRQGEKVERLEHLAAGPALERRASALTTYAAMTTKEIFAKYHQGEAFAEQLVEEMIASLTHSIYGVICLLDPQKIVFGGSISLYQPFVIERIKANLAAYLIPVQANVPQRLVLSSLENNAGIIGAGLQAII